MEFVCIIRNIKDRSTNCNVNTSLGEVVSENVKFLSNIFTNKYMSEWTSIFQTLEQNFIKIIWY